MERFSEEILYSPEIDDFEHPIYIKIILSVLSFIILISSFVINSKLFTFLRRPNRRVLDFIVDVQYSVGIVLVFICMVFFNIIIWAKIPKQFVSKFGCYVGTYLFYFLAPYANCHSFFISLFRYICILYPGKLTKHAITPEVINSDVLSAVKIFSERK